MSERRIFLDTAPGEIRGVVTLSGRPERLLLVRDEDSQLEAIGARLAARVADIEPALATAFLDLGQGVQAILPFKPDARPVRGQLLEVEIRAEARRDKLAIARVIGPADGAPRLLSPAPTVAEQLRTLAPDAPLIEGLAARAMADEAEAEALAILHAMPGGGTLSIEPTRAFTALDVDLGARKGPDAKRVTRQANLTALGMAARLMRLKALGGLAIIDLAGRGHDGQSLLAAARTAFTPDQPGVAIGPVSRFGTMEISLPRRTRPLAERLCRQDGTPSDRTIGQWMVRRLESEAAAHPGARLRVSCTPEVAKAVAGPLDSLAARIGRRFSIDPDPEGTRERFEVSVA